MPISKGGQLIEVFLAPQSLRSNLKTKSRILMRALDLSNPDCSSVKLLSRAFLQYISLIMPDTNDVNWERRNEMD